MKKSVFLLVVLFSTLLCQTSVAEAPSRTISLKRTERVTTRIPSARPLAEGIIPFDAFLNFDEIVISSDISAELTIRVYNSVGSPVVSVSQSVSAGEDVSLDLSDLPAGMYILEIAIDDLSFVGQFEL